jgi:hypothetical protein
MRDLERASYRRIFFWRSSWLPASVLLAAAPTFCWTFFFRQSFS